MVEEFGGVFRGGEDEYIGGCLYTTRVLSLVEPVGERRFYMVVCFEY